MADRKSQLDSSSVPEPGITQEDYHLPGEHFYHGLAFPGHFTVEMLDRIRDGTQTFHPDDILLVTYPKSGTTVSQELIYSVYHGSEKASRRTERMNEVFPFLVVAVSEGTSRYDTLQTMDPPRLLATHLSSFLFERPLENPDQHPRVILVIRDPRDTLVSCYHWYHNYKGFEFSGTWETFFKLFEENRLLFGDPLDYNIAWWKKIRNYPKSLILHYEDFHTNKKGVIQQLADFLGKDLSESEINAIETASDFDAMKMRGTDSYHNQYKYHNDFFRKGQVGEWKSLFTKKQKTVMEERIQHKLSEAGFSDYSMDAPSHVLRKDAEHSV